MKLQSLVTTVLASAIAVFGISYFQSNGTQAQESPQDVEFICADGYDQKTGERLPTTYAWTERGKIAVVRWSTDFFEEVGWSPQQRCEEVSPRFDEAYHNGTLAYLTNGKMNGETVICTSESKQGGCADLLITLRPEDNSLAIVEKLANVLQGRTAGPIRQRSNAEPQAYYDIDMETFLRTAPVED